MNRLLALVATAFLALSASAVHAADPAKTATSADKSSAVPAAASAPASAPKKKEKKGGC